MSTRSSNAVILSSLLLFSFIIFIPMSMGGTTESWVSVSSSPEIYGYGTAVTAADGDIYILNSSTSESTAPCLFWRYNTRDDMWDPLSVPTVGGSSIWAKNGTFMTWDQENYIYAVFGGSYNDSARYYFYRYSIPSDSWERLADTPHTQGAGNAIEWVPGSAVGTGTDWVYAIVGSKESEHGTSFNRYNVNKDSWDDLFYNPSWSGKEGSDDGSSLVWAGGDYLYALQGEWEEIDMSEDREFARFDLTDNTWTNLQNIPEEGGVGDGGSLVWAGDSYSDNIYALGGGGVINEGSSPYNPGDNFYYYSISGDNWTQLESLPYGISDTNGPRLGYANENIYCWRGFANATQGPPDVLWSYEMPSKGVSVSISPLENSAHSEENVIFNVTITNTDTENHNFSISSDDDLGWNMTLSEDNLSLDPENSKGVTLEVAIPSAAAGGTEDDVTVTATAQDNATITSSASCTAKVFGFKIWITPLSQNGDRRDNLSYMVYVKNIGTAVDNYDLIISDNAGWNENVTLAGSGYLETDNKLPTDDVYVEDNNKSANYDWDGDVEVGTYIDDGVYENRRGYWKFNITDIPDSVNITSATFSAFTHYGGESGLPYGDEDVPISVKGVSDDSWSESTLTWNSMPSMGSDLDNVVVPPTDDQRYNWDVTSFVSDQISDGIVSLGAVSDNEGKNEFVPFTAKESNYWDGQQSYLEFSYEVPDVVRLTDISPGENENVKLNVVIPDDASSGNHNIKVEATSLRAGGSSLESGCTVSVGSPTGVEVSISPAEDNAPPGYDMSYEVTITNTGGISDNYDLSVIDDAVPSWSPALDNSLFENVAPGENVTTTLSVSVPENAGLGVEDNILVTATSQENVDVSDNANCIARSAALFRKVEATVSPGFKEGTLGTSLEYSVTVRNEGNVADNYDLSVSDDVVPSWDPSLVDNLFEGLLSGAERTTTLNVTIPDNDNLVGVEDNITVTVTSLENENVDDSVACSAYARVSSTFDLTLSAGWNLVGFQVSNEGTTPDNLFGGMSYTMYYWNAPGGPYGVPFGDVPVEDNLGYWVNADRDNTVVFSGVRPDNREVTLSAGWNLVSFPLTSPGTTPDNLFGGMSYTMYYWNAPGGPYGVPFGDEPVEDNLGYWVKVNQEKTVTVPL